MRKTLLDPKTIYHLASAFTKSIPPVKKRGRPAYYPLPLIITIASVQNLYGFSYREALEFCAPILGEVPSLATFHYRVSTLNLEIVQHFIAFLGMQI